MRNPGRRKKSTIVIKITTCHSSGGSGQGLVDRRGSCKEEADELHPQDVLQCLGDGSRDEVVRHVAERELSPSYPFSFPPCDDRQGEERDRQCGPENGSHPHYGSHQSATGPQTWRSRCSDDSARPWPTPPHTLHRHSVPNPSSSSATRSKVARSCSRTRLASRRASSISSPVGSSGPMQTFSQVKQRRLAGSK